MGGPNVTLLIVADDLTGAADSAARCVQVGLAARVDLQPPAEPLPAGVVALSTDSRYLPPAVAAERVRQMLGWLPTTGVFWYKKIDSTLRGNIGAEIEAMLERNRLGAERPCAVICPAFPSQGRGLEAGCLVHSQVAAHTLHLPTLLASQSQRPQAAISLADVRAGERHLAERLRLAYDQGAQFLVVDALSDQDLQWLVAAARRVLPRALLCGSAGLVEPLARWFLAQGPSQSTAGQPAVTLCPPVLLVVGSGSCMAHQQIAALRGRLGVCVQELNCESREVDMQLTVNAAPSLAWLLHLPKPAAQSNLEGEEARSLATCLAQAAVRLLHHPHWQPRSLVIVGGDTAVHLLAQLGIQQLRVVRELMPGIPLLVEAAMDPVGYPIITKAGSFGHPETLVILLQQLQDGNKPM
jgi:uncharacterized protein YgbK (DUF1537 family)